MHTEDDRMPRLSIALLLGIISTNAVYALPSGFVYLHKAVPTVVQDMRYAGSHNFMGRPVQGYEASTCILSKEAAQHLSQVQQALRPLGLSLKVYDCYRPVAAVEDFMAWSKQPALQQMKAEFYPRVNKADFFHLGYVAEKSGHNRGSTIDLTIVPIPTPVQANYQPGQPLTACTAPLNQRFHDNSIDMGTGYDCLDERAHVFNEQISKTAYQHRMLLRTVMLNHGFEPYEKEWWHFTLKDEPYPNTYFNFPVS